MGAGFVSNDPTDVPIPVLGAPAVEVSSLDLPAGSYVVTAKLELFYGVTDFEVGGQSTALCALTHNGAALDNASVALNRGRRIGIDFTTGSYTATIPLATGYQWGAPFTLSIGCARTLGVTGDSMVARNVRLVAVQVASPLTFG